MEVVMKVKTTPDELYEYIQYIIAKQISNMFDQPVRPEQIQKGYTHKTRSAAGGRSQKMRYTVTKAMPGKVFETTYSSGASQTVVSYRMKPLGDRTQLTYTSNTKVYNGPETSEKKYSPATFYNKMKIKMSMLRAIRQIKRGRG